ADLEVLVTLGYKQKLDEVDEAIRVNADFLSQIVANPEIFGHDLGPDEVGADEASGSGDDSGAPLSASWVLCWNTNMKL
ncbi:hypothetical protein DXG03_007645, partial [Asterophora parasitica]